MGTDLRFEAAIEKLMEQHKPYPDSWALRPGNSYGQVKFYCERCRTGWPCQELNELRWLYGEVNGWEPAKVPYEPLVLYLADEDEETTTPTPTEAQDAPDEES